MKVKNKKIRSLLYASLATIFAVVGLIVTPTEVFADANGALCSSSQVIRQIDVNDPNAIAACQSEGGTVLRAGDTLPLPVCVVLSNSRTFEVLTEQFRTQCKADGRGVIINAGRPLPALTIGATYTPTAEDLLGDDVSPSPDDGGGVCASTDSGERCDPSAECTEGTDPANCGITRYLKIFVNVLSGLVGVVVVGVLVLGGIQYAASAGDPNAAAAARKRINNALLALVAFAFMYGFLQWLVPGGVL